MSDKNITIKDLSIILAITCLWGINFSVIKAGVNNSDPFVLIALRFLFAALPAIFFVKKPNVAWRYIALYGVLCGVGVWGMMAMSLFYGLSVGTASLILEFGVFISVLMGWLFLHEKINSSFKVGLLLSLFGLLFMANINDGSVTLIGFLFALVAATLFSVINLMIKKLRIDNMFSFVAWASIFAPLPLLLMAYAINDVNIFQQAVNINQTALASVLFQAYPTTLLGYWLWNNMLRKYSLSVMSSIKLLVPVFALLSSVLFYDEQLPFNKICAFAFILAGVLLPIVTPSLSKIMKSGTAQSQITLSK